MDDEYARQTQKSPGMEKLFNELNGIHSRLVEHGRTVRGRKRLDSLLELQTIISSVLTLLQKHRLRGASYVARDLMVNKFSVSIVGAAFWGASGVTTELRDLTSYTMKRMVKTIRKELDHLTIPARNRASKVEFLESEMKSWK